MITSRQNQKIKRIKQLTSQAKFRKKENAYVVEGIRLLEEALQANQKPEQVLYTSDLDQRGQALVQIFQDQQVSCELTAPDILNAASDTENSQGIMAVFPINPLPFPDRKDLVLIADEIRDPGNLGTLMRSSLAAGVDMLLLPPGTVDLYSPKVIRSGMGAHFRLPAIYAPWDKILQLTTGMVLYLADMNQGKSCWETDLTGPLGIILGGEAHGPGKDAREFANHMIHIPMNTHSESLNAAAAGAILLFEIRRQLTLLD
jgi:TrmH family RNA methyltransferase